MLRGFYRQASMENNKNVFLIESSLDIYDKDHRLNNDFNLREKVMVREVRYSKNYFSHAEQNFFDYHNTLRQLLVWNFTRYKNRFIMERNNFELDTILSLGKQTVYVISSISQKRTGAVLEGTNRFTLYIDSETFAFVKIKNETIAEPGYYLPMPPAHIKGDKSNVLKLHADSHTYSFSDVDGKMYLESATGIMKGHIINEAENKIERDIENDELLVINEVINGHHDVPAKGFMDQGKNLHYQGGGYNAAFWSNYDQVRLVPLTQKQRRELEWEMSLEKQFAGNKIKK
jgi:hypothetical protein